MGDGQTDQAAAQDQHRIRFGSDAGSGEFAAGHGQEASIRSSPERVADATHRLPMGRGIARNPGEAESVI